MLLCLLLCLQTLVAAVGEATALVVAAVGAAEVRACAATALAHSCMCMHRTLSRDGCKRDCASTPFI
jgi:hypothetical protein